MNNSAVVSLEDEKSVLIVSSHAHLRSHYTEVLSGLGTRIMTAADGFEALATLRNGPVSAVFADYALPGMNAVELYLVMKEILYNVPFIMCASGLSGRTRKEALKVGIFHIIKKPMHRHEIIRGMRRAIEERDNQILKFFC